MSLFPIKFDSTGLPRVTIFFLSLKIYISYSIHAIWNEIGHYLESPVFDQPIGGKPKFFFIQSRNNFLRLIASVSYVVGRSENLLLQRHDFVFPGRGQIARDTETPLEQPPEQTQLVFFSFFSAEY